MGRIKVMQTHERQRIQNTLMSLPLQLLLMLAEVVTMVHEQLSPIQAMHGLNNRYPYVDQRNIEQEEKRKQCQISHTQRKRQFENQTMDHNTMNFHRKFYQCNEVVKDCNVKPLSLTLYFKFLSPCLVSNYFAFGLTYKVSQFPVHVKDKYIYIYILVKNLLNNQQIKRIPIGVYPIIQ